MAGSPAMFLKDSCDLWRDRSEMCLYLLAAGADYYAQVLWIERLARCKDMSE
jgi:hypothetical protein